MRQIGVAVTVPGTVAAASAVFFRRVNQQVTGSLTGVDVEAGEA